MSTGNEQPPVNFHFVTGNPQSEVEKRSVRTIVRSNASNRRWRLARESAAKSRVCEGTEPLLASKGKNIDGDAHPVKHRPRPRQRSNRQTENVQHSSVRSLQIPSRTSLQGPVQVVNLASCPFGPLPLTNVSQQSVIRMLKGTAISYAQLFPSGQGNKPSKVARDWFQQCLGTSGILHTALFCQAMRARASHPQQLAIPSTELVQCQTEAVRAIKHKLSEVETACDDESIRIVFSLTWHGPINQEASTLTPRQSPLSHIQSLNLFMGTIARDGIHAAGLTNMLSLRGGLANVDMPGLAFLVSLGDILQACCELKRPMWHYPSYSQHNPDAVAGGNWLRMIQEPHTCLDNLGLGFSVLPRLLPIEQAVQLRDIFSRFADYTRATEVFLLMERRDRNTAMMADQRNSMQHQMMSLRLDDDNIFTDREVFQLLWLCGLAYSFMAIFPLAPRAARFDRLARLIKDLLPRLARSTIDVELTRLRLWMLCIGGICSIGTDVRYWYLQTIRQEAVLFGITSWQALRNLLAQYLWSPSTSDEDGFDLWTDLSGSRGSEMPLIPD